MRNMKVLRSLAVTFVIGFSATAFCESTGSVIFDDDEVFLRSGIYGLNLTSANVRGSNGSIASAEWLYPATEKFFLGASVGSLLTGVDAPSDYSEGRLSYYYYGVVGEYFLYQYRFLEATSSLFAGMQQLGYRKIGEDENYVSNSFLLLEPGVHAYIRLTSRSKVGVAMSYKKVSEPELAGLSTSDIEGISYSINLRTGVF